MWITTVRRAPNSIFAVFRLCSCFIREQCWRARSGLCHSLSCAPFWTISCARLPPKTGLTETGRRAGGALCADSGRLGPGGVLSLMGVDDRGYQPWEALVEFLAARHVMHLHAAALAMDQAGFA